jgi:hypothetical protein
MAERWSPPVLAAEAIRARRSAVREETLRRSRYIKTGAIEALAGPDLRLLFELYDGLFFSHQLRQRLESSGCPIYFEASRRMTSAGANIGIRGAKTAHRQYRIAVSAAVLFASFRSEGETCSVNGVTCLDRLQSLLILMEHELVHLYEMLERGASGHGASFQRIARDLFGHTDYRHALVTPRQRASRTFDLHIDDLVTFDFEGRQETGRITRISKRATVVPAAGSELAFLKFYVPLEALTKIPERAE